MGKRNHTQRKDASMWYRLHEEESTGALPARLLPTGRKEKGRMGSTMPTAAWSASGRKSIISALCQLASHHRRYQHSRHPFVFTDAKLQKSRGFPKAFRIFFEQFPFAWNGHVGKGEVLLRPKQQHPFPQQSAVPLDSMCR